MFQPTEGFASKTTEAAELGTIAQNVSGNSPPISSPVIQARCRLGASEPGGSFPAGSQLAVVVVTYNSAGVLPGFLESLPAAMAEVVSWRLVVVDNDSRDDSLRLARELAPTVAPDHVVTASGGNLGYAGGVNAGIRAAGPVGSVLVCNPDVRLASGAVAALLHAATTGAGIVVPRIRQPDGELAFSLRREPSVGRALGEAVLGGLRAGRMPFLGEVVVGERHYLSPRRADWATGAVMLLTRRCLTEVGPWDESFFLYSEETDYALRARDAGYPTVLCPDAEAVHIGGEAHVSPPLYALLVTNRVRLFARRNGRLRSGAFWAAVTLGEGVRAAAGRPTSRAALRALLTAALRVLLTAALRALLTSGKSA